MGDDTLFSSYVSGGGYGGYSDFDPSDFGEGFSDEDLGEGWQDYLDLDWAGNDPLGFASEYAGSDFQETELDAFSQFSNYLSERTGLAGTIDQAREEYLDFLVEAGEDESNG